MKTFATLTLVALAGCASPQPQYWVKPGGTEAEFNRTLASCRMQAAGISPPSREGISRDTAGGAIRNAGIDLQEAAQSTQFMQDCLVSQGWTLQRGR